MSDHKLQPFFSGNPVFDAFITVVCAKNPELDIWDDIHDKLLTLAQKEPGGLRHQSGMMNAEVQPSPTRTS